MKSKTFRRTSSGLLSLLLVLQVLVQPVMAVQSTNDLPSETKTEEMKNDVHSETVISPAIKKKLSPLELNYVNRLEDDSFAFLRGPFVMSSENDFDIKDYTFVEKDEEGKVSIIKGEELEEFVNISELNKIIKEYREDYELYEEEKLQELEPVETLLKINYKEYDELSVPLVINDLDNKYESTKNENLTLKRDEEELTKEIFVNSLKDLEELLLNFKGEEEVKDLDIIKVEKVYSGEEDEDTITVEKVFEEVLEEAHEDENKVTSLNLDELDPGYKYIFTLSSKEVKDDNKVLTEITSLEKDQDEKEVEELGKTIIEEETETEEATDEAEATDATDATEETDATEATEETDTTEATEVEETQTTEETKEQKEKTPQENKIEKETTEAEDEKVQEFEKALEETKEEIEQDPNKEEEKKGVVEGLKKLFGLTDLQKADKELKAALKDEKNGLEEIQNLLNSFEEKYELTREEQLQLMDDNGDAIKALIAKDADGNFRPSMLMANPAGASPEDLKSKKFTIRTRLDTSTIAGAIQPGQYFEIKLDPRLTVKQGTTLPNIVNDGTVLAEPSYDASKNTIKYTVKNPINKNLQIPIAIDVDYNVDKIKELDGTKDTHPINNSISGQGVVRPAKLPEVIVNNNGDIVNGISEEDGHDVLQIVEPGSDYKVYMDAHGSPVVKGGKLVAINWNVTFTSTKDLLDLGLSSNATTVKGSGLGDFSNLLLNGDELSTEADGLTKNEIEGKLGIVASKNHTLNKSLREVRYTFETKITNPQEKYALDLSVALNKKHKTGAVRLVYDAADNKSYVEDTTSKRVGITNRTTILGEFSSDTTARWTVTDQVSTGDKNNGLPIATRELTGDQELTSAKMAVYGLNEADGKMVVKIVETNLNKQIPEKEQNPSGNQLPGRIAVYEFNTNITDSEAGYSLSGVNINKYQPIKIKQTWSGIDSTQKMPEQTIKVKDASGNALASPITVGEGETGQADRNFDIPAVKTWTIGDDGSETKITPNIVQTFPEGPTIDGTKYSYKEKYNYYSLEDGAYHLYNVMTESTDEKDSSFTIIKTDSKDPNKKLAGAEFTLQSPRETLKLQTDANGQINFKNISPGTYNLIENKAPAGYKLDQDPKQITVHNDGTVSVEGNNISMQGGKVATVLARHNYYPSYPSYMNAMHYGSIDENGNVEFYIYLKPEANSYGGSTDKNTRLNLNLTGGGKIESVEVLDVAPGNRYTTRTKMQDQTAGKFEGNEVLNKDHANKITGQDNVRDGYTGKTGYQIKFPSSRFDGDWGFLVKVKANGGTSTSTVSYDWLTDNASVANEAKIQKTIGLSTKNSSDSTGGNPTSDVTRITITNEEFQKAPVELTKLDENKVDGLSGATFTLKDSAGNPIIDVQSQSEGEGKTKGLVSFGEQAPGNYTIEEKKAPKGYKNSNVVFDVNVSEDGKVTYKARFKDGDGTPINGLDYILEDVEAGQDATDYNVTVVSQNMKLQEKQSQPDDGRIGWQEGIWEAYGIESYRYNGTYTIGNVVKGGRFKIQFDPNLDFKRYVYEIPDLKDGDGNLLAKPYFNYDTNLLTYVFVKDASNVSASLEIIGIIPDKYYATQTNKTSGYDFKIVVDPDNPKENNTLNFNVKTDYYAYDSQGGGGPLTSEYITDIYKGDDGEIYMKAVSYYNPTNLSSGPRTVRLDWLSMKKPKPGLEYYRADGYPAFGFEDLKVYKVFGDQNRKQNLMPLSYGIRPEQDTSDYIRVYSKSNVDPQRGFSESGGDVRVTYRPEYLKSYEGLLDNGHNKHPLEIDLPRVSGNEGYVIVQTFKVTDEQRFKDLWSGYYLSNGSRHTGSYQKGNYNWAIGSETGQEIPKFYSQRIKLINKKYLPGSFKIKKTNEVDNSVLPGAIFELKNQEGKTLNRYSGSDGIVEFIDLEPGIYTLQEAQAPDGFIKSNRRWQVVVYDTGNVVINEVGGGGTSFTGTDSILIPVSNKPTGGDFKVYKKDSTGNALPGAKFKITKQGETNSTEVISNANGVVEFKGLTEGTYIIEETEAPAGYRKLDKKWVLVVDADGNKKVYNYRENTDQTKIGSILEQENVNWVNVAGRSLDGWNLYDNRRADWTGNYPTPFKLGTRIVGINTKDKYVIQRYVLNPEAESIGKTTGTIHREKVEYQNMDWYNGNAKAGTDYQVYKLDKAVTGPLADIRLADYGAENITTFVEGSAKQVEGRYGEPDRLSLEFPATDKPIVVDIKVPYKEDTGGVGTGMDWVENGTTYWKSDYYERVNIIKESGPVLQGEEGGIQGSYIADNSLDVTNQSKTFGFKLKKVKEKDLATVIPGAEFKLTGPDKGDGSKQEERFMTTGSEGMISFDKLKPGTYKLEENKPAPGYEKSNVDWTVRIADDGKVYIKTNPQDESGQQANANMSVSQLTVEQASRLAVALRSARLDTLNMENDTGLEIGDNLVGNPVKATGWQKVDPTRSTTANHQDSTQIQTKIAQVNKDIKEFKQVFIIEGSKSLSAPIMINFRGADGSSSALRDIKVYQVTDGSTIDNYSISKNIDHKGPFDDNNIGGRTINFPKTNSKYVIELTTSYADNQKLGFEGRFIYDRTKNPPSNWINASAKESYASEADINKHLITINPSTGGSVTSDVSIAKEDDVVTFTVTPDDGYELASLTINNTDQTAAGKKGTFTMRMPNYDVNVTATFKPIPQGYAINIDPNIKNGKVTSNKSSAASEEEFTLTITPDPGYKLGTLSINGYNYTNIVANNQATFTIGNQDLNVSATFVRDPYKSIISFDPNGGSGVMKNQEVYNGYQYTIPNCEFTPPAGKEFLNWTINGYTYTPGTVVTIYQSYTLKAQWKDAPVNLESIKVNSLNHKTTYKVGEELDVTNLTIEATMSNGTKQTIRVNPGMVSGFSSANEAKGMPLTITYGGKTTTYNINVVKPEPDAFDIKIISSTNGKVEADKLTAKEGQEVTLTATANEGYTFYSYTVTDASGNPITVTDNKFTMPKSAVKVSASFIQDGGTTPGEEEIEIEEGKFAQITNKQTGIELKIFKKNNADVGLIGAEFELKKDDGTDTIIAKAVSDEKGNVKFVGEDKNPIKLQVGNYLLTETKSPAGYKKPAAPWKLQVVEEGGQLVIKESGPKHTSTSYLSSEGAKAGDNTSSKDAIKYKSIIKNIDPVNKTFVQRIYIDTRGYTRSNKINVQITPTTKREEIDTPSQPPKTTKGGVKTAYRTTYKVADPAADLNPDDVLKDYDLRKSNVSVVNTARWRPFDWGFDEDQINLSNDGVYFIDIEGFYDDNIVDLKEIELKVDFYAGEWVFAQRTYENGQLGWKYDKDIGDTGGLQTKRDAAYQQGMEALYAYYSKLYGEAAAKTWFYGNPDNKKYDVWLRKGATISGKYYDAGRIVLSSNLENSNIKDATPIQTSYTKADIKDLYSSDSIKTIPQDGMTITNEDETYNITFSKHAKLKTDGSEEDFNANRLEGAVFKLQKREGSFWYDVDESYVASAFNGYFGFRRLEPGRYRLLEVTPPIGYKPIEGELLQFTIKQMDTRSGKIINPKTKTEVELTELTIIDPYNEEKIELKNAKAKIKDDTENKVYNFSELVNTDKFNMDTCMILSEVKDKDGNPKEIPLKTANFIDPESNEPMGRIIAGAQGYITLEYKEGGYVAEYGKAGSSGGSLVDYVTAATAKNMGKILNEKPGKGKVTIKKLDENGNALGSVEKDGLTVGAKFQAIRTTSKKDADGNPVKDAVYEGTVDKDGILVIDGLPVGNYELKEVENPSGHINTGQIWHFTVGGKELDPYSGDIARTGKNLTDKISISKSELKVVRPNAEDEEATGSEGNSVIRPHVGQSLEFDNEFKLDSNIEIQPGDYFVLKLSDNIDLEGVKTDGVGNLDLFADGVGTIAKAEYDKEAGTITYTFTKYAEQYKLLSIENRLGAHINLKNVRNSDPKAQVGLSVGDSKVNHNINIKYIVDTISEYDDNATVNLASKITEYNTNTGEFVHYFYVNRDRYYNAKNQYFQYKPSLDVEDLQLTYYKLKNNNDNYIDQSMPESFAVDESDSNLLRSGGTSPENVSANETKTYNLGNIGPRGSMIVKVTGRMKPKEGQKILSYKGVSALYSTYQYYAYDNNGNYLGIRTAMSPYVDRWDAIYAFENTNTASAELSISAVNPTNRIKFKKVDPQGQLIKDDQGNLLTASFSLFKNGGTAEKPNENWIPKGNAKTIDKDGIVLYEKLEEGYYKVVETTAPEGYIKPTEAVAYFKVDSSGKIYHKVTVKKPNSDETEEIFQPVEGTIPINIVNNKPIEFEKVDGDDNSKKLSGAVFKVLYKENEKGDYTPLKVTKGKEEVEMTVTSDGDGKFKLDITKDGYYALEETKAPEGYSKFPGKIKEFKLEKGKLQVLEKDPLKASLTKGEKGMLTSEILEVDKDQGTFKQRLVINPNHNKWTFDEYDSHLRLFVEGWNVKETNTSKLIKVAVLDNTKTISDLTDTDFKAVTPTNYTVTSTTNPLKYSIKEMYGSTNYTRDQEGRSNLSTDKTLVVEFTGKLKENVTGPVNPKSDVYINAFGRMVDEVTSSLDVTSLSSNEGSYVDTKSPIKVENTKTKYPLTGGIGALIFAIVGAGLMTAAYIGYKRKKVIE